MPLSHSCSIPVTWPMIKRLITTYGFSDILLPRPLTPTDPSHPTTSTNRRHSTCSLVKPIVLFPSTAIHC
ncbi:hypothetical protein PAXRUDRAFT_792036 [Paxillus rubicundulus Ve08.2h10]|uniref:Uncharacterized protein n=1 Tax=Paxillus rubicundulus Ve08.2h10 TaxID=930991 RepID=A0A0D0DUF0_9AGAM|nr:hypothetical protein PAXRUDRAFT_792036 [Paxillus rubicundulus Ve08.2h10]